MVVVLFRRILIENAAEILIYKTKWTGNVAGDLFASFIFLSEMTLLRGQKGE